MYNLKQIAEITTATFVGKQNHTINFYSTDSRTLSSVKDILFVALKTGRNDGHQYIASLIENGVRSFLIQEGEFDYSPHEHSDISFIVSKQPLKTLQTLAAYHRQRFKIPVIGITGSNGKTVVKEWLYQLLKNDYTICRSPKSYNSQIGVPLSILNLNNTHTLAIFEVGISQPNEMDNLAAMVKPTLGVLTSIGSAHDEGFVTREEKIQEKLKLFASCDSIVINGVEKSKLPPSTIEMATVVSEFDDADLHVQFNQPLLKLQSNTEKLEFNIPFFDKASVCNISTCIAVLMQLNQNANQFAQKLLSLQPLALRLEIKNGINGCLLINDFYNSDLDSLKIALNYLQQQNRRRSKTAIVSDIEQSGVKPTSLYKQVADLLEQYSVDLVVGIGSEIEKHASLFKANGLFYRDTESFLHQFKSIQHQFNDSTIILKGARSFGFETISRLLQQKSHDTTFEVNLNKLTDNVNYYRSLIAPNVQLMGIVKAMGYGSGSAEIAKTLQHIGFNYLAVAYADEGVELRQSQINLPIMVMSPEEDALDDIINYQLEPELYSFKVLRSFISKLDALGITEPFSVHLKIDTGMHRLGFEEQDIEALVKELKQTPQLKIKSIFSHLVGSDNSQLDAFSQEQMCVFESIVTRIEKEIGYTTVKHLCNSGGISRFKQAHYNMVRLGIGMYGIGVNKSEQKHLANVGTLKTTIIQIKQVNKDQTVGYNRNGKLTQNTRIATIPIGYADGFSRLLGNAMHGVYIHGQFCKTIGNICMDMCMVDVTNVSCNEGDEVIIFESVEQIQALANALHTIPYEILTSVSSRVKRVYVQE
jgi:alanine racemase